MLKQGIINPQLAKALSSLGHTDTIVLADAGLPIPKGTERVDLAWKANEPRLLPVLKEILEHTVVQRAYLAEEIKSESNAEMHKEILNTLGDIPVTYIPHVKLKEMSGEARCIIRTGEFSPYPNVILESGCPF